MKFQKNMIFLSLLFLINTQILSSSEIIELSEANIEKTISQAQKPLVIKWYATWCGPCKRLAPIFEEFAKKHGDKYVLASADVDKLSESSTKHQIMSMPTITVFKDKKIIGRITGAYPLNQLAQKIEDILKK